MRAYGYVGPEEIRRAAEREPAGVRVASKGELRVWVAANRGEVAAGEVIVTYVVATDGALRVGSRNSEHVACASGGAVLAAGEMTFDVARLAVMRVSNQSTGYCPDVACWDAVAAALDRAGIERPSAWTDSVVFRRCPSCLQRNLVKDDDFACALCGAALPEAWNF